MRRLTGKIAVVTGASKGIGAGIAKELAAQGATVVVNYATSRQGAEKVVSEIVAAGGKASAIGGSVAIASEREAFFAQIKQLHGRIDILVNNAGVYAFHPLEAITEEEITRIFSTNVTGLLLASRDALPLFPSEGASIINIGSVVSEQTPPMTAVYTGTKGAVDAITRVLAKELGPKNIRVNAINPGMTETEGAADFVSSDFGKEVLKQTPLGRFGKPDDIASAVAFLASEDARWITGSLLHVGGGLR